MKEEKRVQRELYVIKVVGYHGVSLVCFYARERENTRFRSFAVCCPLRLGWWVVVVVVVESQRCAMAVG